MYTETYQPTGFTPPMRHDASRRAVSFPALIASLSLAFSIAVLLTVVTVSAARAASLF